MNKELVNIKDYLERKNKENIEKFKTNATNLKELCDETGVYYHENS